MMAAPRKPKSTAHWEALASQWAKHLGEFKTARTARDAMQQGNHLLLLKEASPHGTWRDRANALGLDARLASRLLSVARRFASAPDPFFTAVGTVSKLFVLLPLEPDQVDAICHGEEVCGLTLESIRSMTVVQLSAALRKGKRSESSRRVLEQQALLVEDLALVRPKPVHLSVEEERMLRHYRKCNAEGRAALLQVAGLLEHKSAP